jgi:hypothetical protein
MSRTRSDKTEIRRLRMALRWVHGMLDGVLAADERGQTWVNMARGRILDTLRPAKPSRPARKGGAR